MHEWEGSRLGRRILLSETGGKRETGRERCTSVVFDSGHQLPSGINTSEVFLTAEATDANKVNAIVLLCDIITSTIGCDVVCGGQKTKTKPLFSRGAPPCAGQRSATTSEHLSQSVTCRPPRLSVHPPRWTKWSLTLAHSV